jgi:hypothetical protein
MSIESNRKKILVVVPHYFKGISSNDAIYGSEDFENIESRKSIVSSCYEALKLSFNKLDLDLQIFTIGNKDSSLLNLDIEASAENPRFIPWLAFDMAYQIANKFDYILVIEDDISVGENTIQDLISFNSDENTSDYILIPNRIEIVEGNQFCIDMIAMPGWKSPTINIQGKPFREPINIHSGILLLSTSKFKAAYEARPFKDPTIIIGGYMASAFANMHAYFRILRSLPTSTQTPVFHSDSWVERQISRNPNFSQDFNLSLKSQSLD